MLWLGCCCASSLFFAVQVFGLIGMYISVPKLDAAFLQNVSVDLLATYFGIPLEKDEEVSRGIYMAKPVRRICERGN